MNEVILSLWGDIDLPFSLKLKKHFFAPMKIGLPCFEIANLTVSRLMFKRKLLSKKVTKP